MTDDFRKMKKEMMVYALKDIECLTPRKRKHISFFEDARLIYQLEDTDFYLIYVSGPVYSWLDKRAGWFWYKVSRDYLGVRKSIEETELYDIMEDSDLPTEVLFNIDTLMKLSNNQ
jgi:hypothetical protein